MRLRAFARRVWLEIVRDPLNLAFGLGFPLVLLALLSAIGAHTPAPFTAAQLAPGLAVFGLSFMTLFSAALIARDRGSAFLRRLYTTPLTAAEFILGYTLPLLPMAAAQGLICYLAAGAFGLALGRGMLWAVLLNTAAAVLFIALGLLCGSVLTDRQVGGICGALLTNLTAWLSGAWFDPAMVGGTFYRIARALPFLHAVEAERAVLYGTPADALTHLPWVLGYAAAALLAAVLLFLRQMRRQ